MSEAHPMHWIELKHCFMSTEMVVLLGSGAQDVHLDFHTAPELCDHALIRAVEFMYFVVACTPGNS